MFILKLSFSAIMLVITTIYYNIPLSKYIMEVNNNKPPIWEW